MGLEEIYRAIEMGDGKINKGQHHYHLYFGMVSCFQTNKALHIHARKRLPSLRAMFKDHEGRSGFLLRLNHLASAQTP